MITPERETVARATMEKFEVPGIAILFARGATEPESLFIGTDAAGVPVGATSLFIVASITKLATALCVLRLCDAGALALDDALAKFLPDAASAEPGVTIRALLSHTAGLPQDLPNADALYGTPMTWNELKRECLRVPLQDPPYTRVWYGNVGYGLLALVVERVTQDEFLNVLRAQVLTPLGIEGYLGDAPPRAVMKIADIRSRHAGTDIEPFNSPYYRALGLPWSGLVTTSAGALKLVRAFAVTRHDTPSYSIRIMRNDASSPPRVFLSDALRNEATRNQTDSLPGGYGGRFDYPLAHWGLGVDLKGDKKLHWTPATGSPRTFGHAGATGCCVWHDPDANFSWGIFGTRTADNAWLVHAGPKIAEMILG